ncbi:MAG: hypothetical protein PHY77_05440 [Desulfotomaculaceae bacterium]|nr:hypothetical protein [Desulfotomaculaceae bacterium]
MDQIYQLQRQIQELRNEINTIAQVAGQLQHAEANNAAQLQKLQQHESVANQQLHTIQQLCHHLNQDVNAISNATQQVTSQMLSRPMTSGQLNAQTFSQPNGQFGTYTPNMTSLYNPAQFGTYGAQFSPYMSAGSRLEQNPMPDYNVIQKYTTMPFTSNMMPTSTINTSRAGINPMTSASSMMPSNTSHQHFGTSGFSTGLTSNAYMPYMSSQISSMPSTSLLSSQTPLSAPQNMSFSSF